jgi:hypothetical protein
MTRKVLAIALAGLSLVGVSTASALQLNIGAATFSPYNGTDQPFIRHNINGVQNTTTVSKTVIGTPPRNPHTVNSQTVSISGWNSNNSATIASRCTIYTYDSSNTFIHSRSFCMGGAAGCINVAAPFNWVRSESFTTAQAPGSAYYAVYCTLLPATSATNTNTNRIQSVRVSP